MSFTVVAVAPSTDQILHVGLVTEANREKRNQKWGTQDKAGTGGASNGATGRALKQVRFLHVFDVVLSG